MAEEPILTPLSVMGRPELEALYALEYVRNTLTAMKQLRDSLAELPKAGFSMLPGARSLTIRRCATQPNPDLYDYLPQIVLSGHWLQNAGFQPAGSVDVIAIDKLIIITASERR